MDTKSLDCESSKILDDSYKKIIIAPRTSQRHARYANNAFDVASAASVLTNTWPAKEMLMRGMKDLLSKGGPKFYKNGIMRAARMQQS